MKILSYLNSILSINPKEILIFLPTLLLIFFGQNCSKNQFGSQQREALDQSYEIRDNIHELTSDSVNLNSQTTINENSLHASKNDSANLSCSYAEPDITSYPLKYDSTGSVTTPTNFVDSPFENSLNNQGQDWRYSNTLNLSGKIELWSYDSHSGYMLNGSHVNLSRPAAGCRFWHASVIVNSTDNFSLALMSLVFGARHSWMIVSINGSNSLWQVSTLDYKTVGGHNPLDQHFYSGFKSGTCMGQLIGKSKKPAYPFNAMDKTMYHSKSGCVDEAQKRLNVKCVQIPPPTRNGPCLFFNGPEIDAVNLYDPINSVLALSFQ